MATSPPNENNWEDSKHPEIPIASEQSTVQQNISAKDNQKDVSDKPTNLKEEHSSQQHDEQTPLASSATNRPIESTEQAPSSTETARQSEQINSGTEPADPTISPTEDSDRTEILASPAKQLKQLTEYLKQHEQPLPDQDESENQAKQPIIEDSDQTEILTPSAKQLKQLTEYLKQHGQPLPTDEYPDQVAQPVAPLEQHEYAEPLAEHPDQIAQPVAPPEQHEPASPLTEPTSKKPLLNSSLNPLLKVHTLHRLLRQQARANSAPTIRSKPSTDETTEVTNKPKKRLRRGTRIALTILAVLLVLGSGLASAGYYYYTTTIQKPLAQIYRPVTRSKNEATPQPTATSAPVYDVIKGRSWNILLLGSDNDGKYTFPDVLTQVMMIVHVDTVKNTVTMVSIPRDSWVSVPGFGMHKIDQAFSLGEQQTGKFEDGVRTARDTVETDYGITIDRYAWVGLDGFSKVIDTLGGIDIDVEHPIVDDNYPNDVGSGSNAGDNYAYKRIYIAAGPQHLNGQAALEYVRSRHSDLVGDIGRTQRQQQVLEALKLKLNVATVIENFTQLLNDISGNIYTDLNESEMLAFANYGRTLLNTPIQHVTLGVGSGSQDYGDLTTIYDASVGANQDIVQPNCVNIQPEINRIFNLGNVQSCNTGG